MRLTQIMSYSDSYAKVVGILARYIRSKSQKSRSSISDPVTPEQYQEAEKVLLWLSMSQTKAMEDRNQLTSLAVFWVGGVCYTRGRVDQDSLEKMLGKDKLPVLSPKSRLAELIMIRSHAEDHRMDWRDAQYRSRRHAWITNSSDLAKRVVSGCLKCRKTKAKLQEQRISDLPREMFDVPCQVYTNVVLDYAGPFLVSNPTRKRSTMKTWVMVISCLNTGSVNAVLCPDYSTDTFLKMLSFHAHTYRWPKVVFCDRASNFLAGKDALASNDDLPDHDWAKVTENTAINGVQWRVNPAQSQHRTGRAERAVASLKKTIKHMHEGSMLCYTEFQLTLVKATRSINLRPIGIQMKNSATAGYAPITPLKLVMGPEAGDDHEDFQMNLENQGSLVKRMRMIEEIHAAWWKKWFMDCFPGLLPLPRWKERARNLQVHDICLLSYNKKYGPDAYRYCRVTKTFPDHLGLVRSVEVILRPRRVDEAVLPYLSKPPNVLKVSVQRLVLLSPVEEQESEATTPEPEVTMPEPETTTPEATDDGSEMETSSEAGTNRLNLLQIGSILVSNVVVAPADTNSAHSSHPAHDDVHHAIHPSPVDHVTTSFTDTMTMPWDSNGNLALTLGRTEDIPHACTSTLCPADLGFLDHMDFSDVDILSDMDVSEMNSAASILIPDDGEVESLTSVGD